VRFPDVRCVIVAVDTVTTSRQAAGCASAVGWHEADEHDVVAPVPPPNDRGGVP
jgi:hypothetical protein